MYYLDNHVVYREDVDLSPVVRATERRRSETPAGVMTTSASPTLGASTDLSMWEVAMTAGACGPVHVFDSEQIWTVLDGEAVITIAGTSEILNVGDTAVIPEGLERRVKACTDVRLIVCGHGNAIPRVPGEPEPRATPSWIA